MEGEVLTEKLRETLVRFGSSGEPRTTPEVAEDLGLGRRATYNRLERLVEHGRLRTKKVGANARVWWRPLATVPDVADWPAAAKSLVDDVFDDVEVGVFVLDENFDVVWSNKSIERYFGVDRSDIVGRDKRELIEERIRPVVNDADQFAETVLATYDDNTYTEQFECRVTPGEGREERWLEHRSRPIKTGAYEGGRVELYYDVTDRKQAQLARREDREQFESLVSAVEEYAIFTLDPTGHVATWNPGVERIKGYEAEGILREHFSIFYTEEDRTAGVPEQHLADAAENGSIDDEGWRVRDDGSRFWANATLSAIRDDDGRLQGYAKVTRDMTEQRERERQLQRERDLTERLLETAPVRLAVFRTDGSVVRMNAQAKQGLGIDEAAVPEFGIEDFDIYDADGNRIPEDEHPINRVLETGCRVSDRLVQQDTPDGRRWISLTAAPLFDGDGAIERVVVASRDVTDLKRKERQLERSRDELKAELDDIFTRIDDAFYALDEEMRFEYVNDRAEELLGYSESELLGKTVWDALSISDDDPVRGQYRTAMVAQEQTAFERYSDPLGVWEIVRIYPSESGLSVYFTDVTERKEREQDLQLYETIVETIEDGIYVVNDDLRIQHVNEAYTSMTGYTREELLGSHISMVVDEDVVDSTRGRREQLRAGEAGGAADVKLNTASGAITVEARYASLVSEDGGFRGTVGAIRDVTERKERERELEEYRRWTRTLIENFPSGAVALVDENLRYITFGGTPEGETDVTREDLEGRPVREVLPEQTAAVVVPRYEAALDGNPSAFVDTIDGRVYQFHFVPVRDDDGEVFAATAISQDITEQKEREYLLEEAKTQLEAATEAGAVGTWEWQVPDDEFVVGASFARTFGVDPEAAREGVPPDQLLSAVHEDDREGVERAIDEAMSFCGEYREEYRVWDAADDLRWVIARGHVECDDEGAPVSFPGALVDITDRKHAEQELEHQRAQLSAMNSLNEVVRDITAAVIDQSTREQIEETVCDRLAASESYLFAWIGEADPNTQTVALRTEAGVEGYLDGVTISVDSDDPRSEGPTGRAFRTGETQVTHDIRADSRHDPWREHIEQYGIRSSAAIPIAHEGTVYGVLNVYADRPYAFEGQERAVVGQLGEIVGHAIIAAERKQALLSDELVELDVRIQDVFAAVGVPVEAGGTITLDDMVPAADGEFLVYGTATPDALDTVHGLVDVLPHWESVVIVSDDDDPVRFELRLIDPPVLSEVASRGGYIEESVIEGGDYRMTIHLAPSVDVREITDTVKAVYPQAELLRRRQISQPRAEPRQLQHRLVTDLTDRQRTVLEAAYRSGYFEWPRASTGERIADSLGLASPTFHQHLRKAQQKAFDVLLSPALPTQVS